jgi:hypothetical protein
MGIVCVPAFVFSCAEWYYLFVTSGSISLHRRLCHSLVRSDKEATRQRAFHCSLFISILLYKCATQEKSNSSNAA